MFRPNYRARVYTSFAKAAADARGWGGQTGRKYRVSRFRDGWIVRPTRKRSVRRHISIKIKLCGGLTPLT